jgi:hypothetical protein
VALLVREDHGVVDHRTGEEHLPFPDQVFLCLARRAVRPPVENGPGCETCGASVTRTVTAP